MKRTNHETFSHASAGCLALVAAACGGTEASEDVASLETAGDGLELAVPEELESESELTQEEA